MARAVIDYQDDAPPADDPATWVRRAEAAELVGAVAAAAGDMATAEASYRRSHQAALAAGSSEGSVEARCRAAVQLGLLQRRRNEFAGATESYKECMALAGSAPGPRLREQVLLSQVELAHVAFLRGESSAARKLVEEGIPGAVALMNEAGGPGADVAVVLWQFRLVLWEVLYDLAESPAEYETARDVAQAAVELARARAAARPDDAVARYHLSIAYVGLGRSSVALGDDDAAERYYRQALSESRALSERDPSNLRWLRGVGVAAGYMEA